MLSDDDLKNRNNSTDDDDKSTLRTFNGVPKFSSFNSTPGMNMLKSGLEDLLNPDLMDIDPESSLNNALNNLASIGSQLPSPKLNIDGSEIEGDDDSDGILKKLLKLIMNIVKLPLRFSYLFKSLMEGTGALVLGIGGITQSVALGSKDIYTLIVAILKIILKYAACILSFIISTIAGCSLIHVFTMYFVMLYLFLLYLSDKFNELSGIDLSPFLEKSTEYMKWPEPVGTFCYSCFGKKVKLREVISDVGVIEDIGNMISFDFNNVMPRYMKPATPLGSSALKSLDKAIN